METLGFLRYIAPLLSTSDHRDPPASEVKCGGNVGVKLLTPTLRIGDLMQEGVGVKLWANFRR